MDPRNIVKFSAKPELLVDSAVDEEVQGRIDSKQEIAHLGGLWVIRTYVNVSRLCATYSLLVRTFQ